MNENDLKAGYLVLKLSDINNNLDWWQKERFWELVEVLIGE